ncbi:YccF domain-containing protein [Natroniella sp. ANB-PHB2]|uniref:YccF domain-containing protein n=1 Tax=Natroniella sp. ANB-PHB2 TaxID=3384444 RepID=UPI0038D4CA04
MKFLGNLLWFILGGWAILLEYLLGGIALCLTIIGIPFGIQVIKLSWVAAWPFGKRIVPTSQTTGLLSLVMNLVWLLFGGIWTALTHLILAVVFGITIIGLPFAKQHLKLASLAFTPFSKSYKKY